MRRTLLLAIAALLVLTPLALSAGVSTARSPVIVTLRGPASAAAVDGLARAAGGLQVTGRFAALRGFSALATPSQLRALARQPQVRSISRDLKAQVDESDARTSFGVSKAQLDLPGLTGNTDGNAAAYSTGDMVVAVLDSGVDPNHASLNGGKVIAFKDVVNGRTVPYDDNGHGTAVASIVAGTGAGSPGNAYRGVAPGAAVVAVKVTAADGVADQSKEIAGLEWVIANKATYNIRVVNISLGTSGCWDGTDPASQEVNKAVAAGLVVVVAAGNAGPYACTVKSPGAAADAVTVANMADTGVGGFTLASDSSRGPTSDGRIKPDVAGPGINIPAAIANTASTYDVGSGTSASAPFVAGVALLMLEANPSLTPAQVKSTLLSTAIHMGRGGDDTMVGSTGPNIDYGAGRLDAYAALRAAGAALSAPPKAAGLVHLEGALKATGDQQDFPLGVVDGAVPLAATVIVPSTSAAKNFTAVLLDPNGQQVSSSTTTTRQQTVSVQTPVPGTYTLRVASVAGSGDFFADVSGDLGTPDTAPPTLSLPADITADATSAAGANVTYTAKADDKVDGAVPVTCTPAAGAQFAVGTTTVGCTAADKAGNKATGSFRVTVRPYVAPGDTTPPVLRLPTGVVANATAPAGALVTYAAAATDAVDGPVAVTCGPASGARFAVGTTQVACSAADRAGNVARGTFAVVVHGALDQTNALRGTLASYGPRWSSGLLSYYLTSAASRFAAGQAAYGCNEVGTFQQVLASWFVRWQYTPTQFNTLWAGAVQIRAAAGC